MMEPTKPTDDTAIRVVLVDDHPLFREGVASLLARAGGIVLVGEAANGQEAIQIVESLLPDIVLMNFDGHNR